MWRARLRSDRLEAKAVQQQQHCQAVVKQCGADGREPAQRGRSHQGRVASRGSPLLQAQAPMHDLCHTPRCDQAGQRVSEQHAVRTRVGIRRGQAQAARVPRIRTYNEMPEDPRPILKPYGTGVGTG